MNRGRASGRPPGRGRATRSRWRSLAPPRARPSAPRVSARMGRACSAAAGADRIASGSAHAGSVAPSRAPARGQPGDMAQGMPLPMHQLHVHPDLLSDHRFPPPGAPRALSLEVQPGVSRLVAPAEPPAGVVCSSVIGMDYSSIFVDRAPQAAVAEHPGAGRATRERRVRSRGHRRADGGQRARGRHLDRSARRASGFPAASG